MPETAPGIVLDSSAVLAVLFGEPGASQVISALPASMISSVNAAEVFRKLARHGSLPEVRRTWDQLELTVAAFGLEDAAAVAEVHRESPALSLGDCACLALAQRLRVPVLTADRVWGTSRSGVTIRQIR